MCILINAYGTLRVVGSSEKTTRSFYKNRQSITMVRTGATAGTTGPTIFLLKGSKRKEYTDDFLLRHGLAPGSTIARTENAFMTNEACIQSTQKQKTITLSPF